MKLYIKQQVFTWGDQFTVKDEYGNDRYFVQGEIFTWGKKLHVYDINDVEVLYIQQKIMTWLPRYHIHIHGIHIADIVKEFTFLRPRYRVEGLDWNIEGSFWAHDYTVMQGNRLVVSITKEWLAWGDSYVLYIGRPQDELAALAVVLTIDCVMAQQTD